MPRPISLFATALLACTAFGQTVETHNDIAGQADLRANARDLEETVVTPHLEQEMHAGKNILWCNTFQLAWNELCQQMSGSIDMADAPPMVTILNKQKGTKEDLDAQSYIAVAGLASEGIFDEIRRALDEKFGGRASSLMARIQRLRAQVRT